MGPKEPRDLPSGVVTFVMTDVEASGTQWTSDPRAMAIAVRDLDAIVAGASEPHGGVVLKSRGEGDSHFVVFARPSEAVLTACELQGLMNERRLEGLALRVRIGIHTGDVDPADADYYGIVVNQTARLRALAHGGQSVLSHVTAALARTPLAGAVRFKSLGHHRIRDFPKLEEVFQATLAGSDDTFPPVRTGDTRAPAIMAIVAVDVCGSSQRAAHNDDLIRWQRALGVALRRVAELRDAAALKLVGDGCLAAFEDPINALAFLHDAQAGAADLELRLRSGIEIGRVELFDGDVVGLATFVASELCQRAEAGQIVGSSTFVDLVGSSGDAVSLGRAIVRVTGSETELFAL